VNFVSPEPNWFKILKQCQTNVHTAIQPHLTPNQPLLNLGRGAGGAPMKPVDLAAETALVDTLQENGLSFSLISEESGFKSYGSSPKDYFVHR
jgi:fructose-1,6-bisphosphatase/inositol monophosphatase family enzyme